MSVLIKGMEMPEFCEVCPCYNWVEDICRITDSPNDFTDTRVSDCPLVEVPTPHGRLIDADKLQTAIHGCLCENCQTFPCEKGIGCLIEDVFNLLDEAPTIIEAEVSE